MRVVLRTPDNTSREQIIRALSADASIEIVDDMNSNPDVQIIHAQLFRANGRSLRSMTKGARTIVTSAPRDPGMLSGFLASGVLGYQCVGESVETLIDVLRLVAAGGARSDPVVMDQLLRQYRQLLRDSIRH